MGELPLVMLEHGLFGGWLCGIHLVEGYQGRWVLTGCGHSRSGGTPGISGPHFRRQRGAALRELGVFRCLVGNASANFPIRKVVVPPPDRLFCQYQTMRLQNGGRKLTCDLVRSIIELRATVLLRVGMGTLALEMLMPLYSYTQSQNFVCPFQSKVYTMNRCQFDQIWR